MGNIDKVPFVAIWMVTYNQEKYISQAIKGVLSQKVDFDIRLFIGEDSSTDGTREICKDFEREFPNQIKVISTQKNDISLNSKNIYDACFNSSAKYIAMCEGDDYWTDPMKLKKQVEFLEKHDDFSICCHRVLQMIPGKQPAVHQGSNLEETYIIDDLAKANFIATASVVFRNGLIKEFPYWFRRAPVGDYVLHMLNARHGKIKYFPQPMAVYRHGSGFWSGQQKDVGYKKLVKVIDFLLMEFSEAKVRQNLILQKLDYLMWIEDWGSDFNPGFSREETIILLDARRNDKKEIESILNDPGVLASKVSIKTLVKSIFKKLTANNNHDKK